MTLGERCDEIIRLIDEAVGNQPPAAPRPAVASEPAPRLATARRNSPKLV